VQQRGKHEPVVLAAPSVTAYAAPQKRKPHWLETAFEGDKNF